VVMCHVHVQSQGREREWSCVMYMYKARGEKESGHVYYENLFRLCFYDCSNVLWNCSEGVECLCYSFVIPEARRAH
jgi:hypothetical protein